MGTEKTHRRLLGDLEGLAHEAGAIELAREAGIVAERLREGRFYVACVGQFKRGKSTLINALVQDNVLPVGVVPVTSVITVVRWGERLAARVRFGQRVGTIAIPGRWRPTCPRSTIRATRRA